MDNDNTDNTDNTDDVISNGSFEIINADDFPLEYIFEALKFLEDKSMPWYYDCDTSNRNDFDICFTETDELVELKFNNRYEYIIHIEDWVIKLRDHLRNFSRLLISGQLTFPFPFKNGCEFYKMQIVKNEISFFQGQFDYKLMRTV